MQSRPMQAVPTMCGYAFNKNYPIFSHVMGPSLRMSLRLSDEVDDFWSNLVVVKGGILRSLGLQMVTSERPDRRIWVFHQCGMVCRELELSHAHQTRIPEKRKTPPKYLCFSPFKIIPQKLRLAHFLPCHGWLAASAPSPTD